MTTQEGKREARESPGLDPREEFSHDELQLAARNHGIPLEALRYDVIPLGLHYLLIGSQTPKWAWQSWGYDWKTPEPGSHVLCSRATDEAGNRQPSDVLWNLKGYANNAIQRVAVIVRG